jgi:hypothetical protein
MTNYDNSSIQFPAEFNDEFEVDQEGRAFVSQRGLARLCGIGENTLRDLLSNLGARFNVPENLESLSGYTVEVRGRIPDTVASCIIHHYAYYAKKKTPEAKRLVLVLQAIGLRSLLQRKAGWWPDNQLSDQQLRLVEENTRMIHEQDALRIATRQRVKDAQKKLNAMIQRYIVHVEETPRVYAAVNDGINLAVFGMTAKEFKSRTKLDADAIRDYLPIAVLECLVTVLKTTTLMMGQHPEYVMSPFEVIRYIVSQKDDMRQYRPEDLEHIKYAMRREQEFTSGQQRAIGHREYGDTRYLPG